MAFPIEVFLKDFDMEEETAALLAAKCTEAGLDEVIDLAMVEPSMVPAILGPDTEPLGPTLLKAMAWAEKVAEGWARGQRN